MPALTVSSAAALESAPSVLPEQHITLFKFYMHQSMHDGMSYGNELYRLVEQFGIAARLEAYRLGCELIRQGVPTIISVSKQRYTVWMSLRSPSAITVVAQ